MWTLERWYAAHEIIESSAWLQMVHSLVARATATGSCGKQRVLESSASDSQSTMLILACQLM